MASSQIYEAFKHLPTETQGGLTFLGNYMYVIKGADYYNVLLQMEIHSPEIASLLHGDYNVNITYADKRERYIKRYRRILWISRKTDTAEQVLTVVWNMLRDLESAIDSIGKLPLYIDAQCGIQLHISWYRYYLKAPMLALWKTARAHIA